METYSRSSANRLLLIFVAFFLGTAIISVPFTALAQSSPEIQNDKDRHSEHYRDLKDFKAKFGSELANLQGIAFKATSKQFSEEARKLVNETFKPFSENRLAEVEEKLQISLSLSEDQFARKDFALVLIEEKKYLEALPSCVDAALGEHDSYLNPEFITVEGYALPLPMLSYALSQVGEIKQAAIVYNFTRMKLEKDIARNISQFRKNRKSDSMTINADLRLPLPPVSVDPEKVSRKALIENNRVLFFILCEMDFNRTIQETSSHSIFMPNRAAFQMIEDAFKENPDSPVLSYMKGYMLINEIKPKLDALIRIKMAKDFYQKAIKLSGEKAPLGKLAFESINELEKIRIILEQRNP